MNKKKRIIINLLLISAIAINGLYAQDTTTVNALNDDISENLDLKAVASIFGDAKDLKDFENKINDPRTQISNLDLNDDSFVDYLRVVETSEKNIHLIAIQAVLGEDQYQDVATIEVEKNKNNDINVQVVGDVYMYGPDYIIEPVFVVRPVLFSLFWRPYYHPYRSVFYWGFYPKHFHFWHPHHLRTYRRNIQVHINVHNKYRYTHVRRSARAIHIHNNVRRNDFGRRFPNKSYAVRTKRTTNLSGTKKGSIGVIKANGTKKKIVGVNKPNGDKIRVAGVNKSNGTKKRVVSVKKSNGTSKKAYAVKRPNGNKKVVVSKKRPKNKKNKKTLKKNKRKPQRNKSKNKRR